MRKTGSRGLGRQERLRGRQRLDELFSRGAAGKSRFVVARALPNGMEFSRVAVMAPKAAGKSSRRNRIRRRLRAAFRLQKQELPAGIDLALLPRRGLAAAGFQELCAAVKQAVQRASAELPARGREA